MCNDRSNQMTLCVQHNHSQLCQTINTADISLGHPFPDVLTDYWKFQNGWYDSQESRAPVNGTQFNITNADVTATK